MQTYSEISQLLANELYYEKNHSKEESHKENSGEAGDGSVGV